MYKGVALSHTSEATIPNTISADKHAKAMRPLLPAKEVRVDGLHLERLNRANPHVVVDHVVRELIPVDEHHALLLEAFSVLPRRSRESSSRAPIALPGSTPRQIRACPPGPSVAARVTSTGGGLEPPRDYRRSVPGPCKKATTGTTCPPSSAK